MDKFINDKLRMLFICKDDKAMEELATSTMVELTSLTPESEDMSLIVETYGELMSNRGYLPHIINEGRLDKVAKITIVTWFGIYKFYSAENGYSALLGSRENVLVLDDELEIPRLTYFDSIEPIASEYGDMILLSKFKECKSKTKYTRQLHRHVKELHGDLVFNNFKQG